MSRIAFVTTCKNRLHHLQQTLPRWVAEEPDEIVVVDYGCPQGTGDWVEANHPQVKVLRVSDDPGFCLSRARNLGAARVSAEWVCFVDADILVEKGWLAWMRSNLQEDHFYRPERLHGDANGTVILPRKAFDAVSGYDTRFRGWGGEDTDLYHRLECVGWQQARYPARFAVPIPHEDAERFVYMDTADRLAQLSTNALYLDAKRVALLLGASDGELPDATRSRWREEIEEAVARWTAQAQRELPSITFVLERFTSLSGPLTDQARCEVTVSVQRLRASRRDGGGFVERMGRRWRRLRGHLRGVPENALDAIEAVIKVGLRPYADGQRALPNEGVHLSVDGYGARLPYPYRVHIHCDFILRPRS